MMFRALCILAMTLFMWGCQTKQPVEKQKASETPKSVAAAWYEPEILAFEAADKASPPKQGQVLFIGSSSIRLWTSVAADMRPAPVLNRGFGGSKTGDVLAVFDRIVLPYKPSVIVYYCGDNDLGMDNVDSQAAAMGFIRFDERARKELPGVVVIYIPIKPSVQRWGNWPAMKRANDIVREYCERTAGAEYVDTATPMLNAEGAPELSLFKEDGLHMNAKGYAIWAPIVRQSVMKAWKNAGNR